MSTTNNAIYGPTAWFYDVTANIYSGGQIRACKESQLNELKRHDKVLYVGAGGGEDVVMAARLGLEVTAVELSEDMVTLITDAVKKEGLEDRVEVICANAFAHKRSSYYDAVVANFFLNVFTESVMIEMLSHLTSLVKPKGKVLIADFAPLSGHPVMQAFQWLYHAAAQGAFVILANNPWHPIYDYPAYFSRCGLTLRADTKKGLVGVGPKWYRTITAIKSEM